MLRKCFPKPTNDATFHKLSQSGTTGSSAVLLPSTSQTMKPLIAIPAIIALVYRAYSRKSLTPVGILTALATAVVHAIHPWSVFIALLAVFFLAGTAVTKVSMSHQFKVLY